MRRFLLLLVAASALAALWVRPAPASAATWNHRWSYLHFPDRNEDTGLVRRTITLRGTYRWRIFVAHALHQDQPRVKARTVRLVGRYVWSDWLLRGSGRSYSHVSTLTNARTGGKVTIGGQPVLGSFGDGNYHWGSTLDNVRARR